MDDRRADPFSSGQTEYLLVGRSEAARNIDADIECASRSDAKVLITGETGSGKEVVARLIHQRSKRASAPLVVVNCAGLTDSLLESELFGHVKGSFTGAYRDKPGLLEMAPNGTVFLDEVGEMTMRMQAVVLRFIETGEIQRVGADRAHSRVNARLITATNRDLHGQIAAGSFREDLYYRLNVIRVCVPPLRERVDDIPLLLDHYLDIYSRHHKLPRRELSEAAMTMLKAYRWPGNVRQLKNVLERIVLKASSPTIEPSDLPNEILPLRELFEPSGQGASAQPARPSAVEVLTGKILNQGESFWSAVYPIFMSRDLTREDLRKIVQIGLEQTNGNYRLLTQLFNMPDSDYKRFLSFLRKHECHLPFQKFRVPPTRATMAARQQTPLAVGQKP